MLSGICAVKPVCGSKAGSGHLTYVKASTRTSAYVLLTGARARGAPDPPDPLRHHERWSDLNTKVRKAIFPVAGLGTRFLPATKAMPKELLPIIDKPVIQYAVEEAIEAGITELIFVTGRTKRAIEDHFVANPELEHLLAQSGKDALLAQLQNIIPAHVACVFVRQPQALGLGHAILCAQAVVDNEPFAVLLPDDLMAGPVRPTQDLLESFEHTGKTSLSVAKVPTEDLHRYGVIVPVSTNRLSPIEISGIVEKPTAADAPSDMAAIGRYVFTPEIFDHLKTQAPGVGGEIQLTDSINVLAKMGKVDAVGFNGKRYDCGSKFGYLEAIVDHALAHPEFGAQFAALIRRKSADPEQAPKPSEPHATAPQWEQVSWKPWP